jgi:hypothetical protein
MSQDIRGGSHAFCLSLGNEADAQWVLRLARLDLSIDIKDRLRGAFKKICEPYPSLQQLDVRFQHYDNDSVPPVTSISLPIRKLG